MKTKLFLTTLAFFALLLVGNLNAQFGGGLGTEANPYQIWNKEHLKELDDSVKKSPINDPITYYNWSRDKYFILMNDITDTVKTVIGYVENTYEFTYCFQGDFNGNNKKIILAIDGYEFVGLFSAVYQSNIYDLMIEGYVRGSHNYIGSICGYAQESHIENCFNNGNIRGGSGYVGGICGYTYYTNISNCINNGNVKGNGMLIGGIIGFFLGGQILRCTNEGDIVGITCVGGIIGHTDSKCLISHCTNSGSVTANNYGVGGIVGHFKGEELSYCINIGTIIGKDKTIGEYPSACAGGIVGMGGFENDGTFVSLIHKCINSGLLRGTISTGGIIGRVYNGDRVSNCINTGAVSSSSGKMGCIAGEVEAGGTIINCHYDKQMCGGGE